MVKIYWSKGRAFGSLAFALFLAIILYLGQNVDRVILKNTRILDPGEAFTIVVTWSKRFICFLKDNWPLQWLLSTLSVILWWYLRACHRLREFRRPGTIIPLFEPPRNLSAAAVSYLKNMQVNFTVFASSFIDIAVQGLLEIEHKPRGWFSSDAYKLIRNSKPIPEEFSPEYQSLLSGLSLYSRYSRKRELWVKRSEQNRLAKGYKALEKDLKADYGVPYIQDTSPIFKPVIAINTFSILVLLVLGPWSPTIVIFPVLIIDLLAFVFIASFPILKAYTREGRKLMDEIEGFKLFLSTPEIERLKIIGTPPTKTPELYEKYLPYAVALGVERQWTQQFVSVFEKLRKRGVEYRPMWYRGPHTISFTRSFTPQALVQNLSSSLRSSITPSDTRPGSANLYIRGRGFPGR